MVRSCHQRVCSAVMTCGDGCACKGRMASLYVQLTHFLIFFIVSCLPSDVLADTTDSCRLQSEVLLCPGILRVAELVQTLPCSPA